MEGKGKTYGLMFVMAVVWIAVIYKIVSAVSGSNDLGVANAPKSASKPTSVQEDGKEVNLLLNYRDPFLGGTYTEQNTVIETEPKPVPVVKRMEPVEPRPTIDWSFIRYMGAVSGKNGKKVALVNVSGKEMAVAEGAEFNGILFRRVCTDSLEVIYSGELKVIVK